MKLLTLAIGEDFRKSLGKALNSKKRYCEKRGYEYILGDEKFWDREKPIPWSKIPFLLDVLKNSSDGEFIFMSDADVYITNMDFDIVLIDGSTDEVRKLAIENLPSLNKGAVYILDNSDRQVFENLKFVLEPTKIVRKHGLVRHPFQATETTFYWFL